MEAAGVEPAPPQNGNWLMACGFRRNSLEIRCLGLQVLPVVLPRLAVDAWRRVPLHSPIRRAQPPDAVDVVQERREPLPPVLLGGLTYPLERAWRACPALCPEHVLAAGGRGTSRFPCEVFPGVLGVSDRAGSSRVSRWRRARCRLPPISTASAPRSGPNFCGSIPGPHGPLSTLHPCPHGQRRMTRGRCGLLPLHRTKLPFAAPRRF